MNMDRRLSAALGALMGFSVCLTFFIGALVLVPDQWIVFIRPMIPGSAQAALDDPNAEGADMLEVPPDMGADPADLPDDSAGMDADTPTPEASETPAATPNPVPSPDNGARVVLAPADKPTATATSTPKPTKTPTPKPTATPTKPPANLVNDLLNPLIQEARKRRVARERADPSGYARRVDKNLNLDRINFLIYGYGTTFEPPQPAQYKGSIAIYSLNLRTLQIDTVTLNHDIRAPEVERFIKAAGRTPPPTKLHFAYPNGGFDLMRQTVEDATGLSVDFQLTFQDAMVKEIVDDVFGGLSVSVPWAFDAEAIYFQDVKYPARRYPAGRQTLNGIQVLQFIKSIQLQGTGYDPSKELAVRKQIVVKAVLDTVKQQSTNPVFWARILSFLKNTMDRQEVTYDFDAPGLVFRSVGAYVLNAARGQAVRLSLGRSVYVVDPGSGDGGVEWLTSSQNPIVLRDWAAGVYKADPYMSIPVGNADPYAADLLANYWQGVRQLVRGRLPR